MTRWSAIGRGHTRR